MPINKKPEQARFNVLIYSQMWHIKTISKLKYITEKLSKWQCSPKKIKNGNDVPKKRISFLPNIESLSQKATNFFITV